MGSPTTSTEIEELEKRHKETIWDLKKEHSIQIKKVQESMQENYDYLLQSIPNPPQSHDAQSDNLPRAPVDVTEEPPWQYGEDDWYEYGYWEEDGYWYWNDDENYEKPTSSPEEDFRDWWKIHRGGPPP